MEEIFENYWRIKSFINEIPSRIPVLVSSGDPYYEAINPSAPQLNLYFNKLKNESKVLDIGAGDKYIEIGLKKRGIAAKYFSMDTAKRNKINYDFESLDKISERFDLIIMQEVLEHLPLEIGYRYLKRAYELLNDDGFLVVTTPNTRKPVWFRDADLTHIQSYPLQDLYGLMRMIGFLGRAEFRRIEIRNRHATPKQKIKRFIQRILFRLMDFDYAHGILIKIRKS